MTFECPICYGNGLEAGIIKPSCKHEICITCYSSILLENPNSANCPCCRKAYKLTSKEKTSGFSMDDLQSSARAIEALNYAIRQM